MIAFKKCILDTIVGYNRTLGKIQPLSQKIESYRCSSLSISEQLQAVVTNPAPSASFPFSHTDKARPSNLERGV